MQRFEAVHQRFEMMIQNIDKRWQSSERKIGQ